MSRVVVFSDLHIHTHRAYSDVLDNGLNSRVQDAASCLDQIYDYCMVNDIDLVLCAGDLFHVRRTISVQAFNAAYECLAKFTAAKIPTVLIPGNHDQSDREGSEHSIFAFQNILTIMDKMGWHTVTGVGGDEYAIMAVPYSEDVDEIKRQLDVRSPSPSAPQIFLGHLGVQNALVGADFVHRNPADPAIGDLRCSAFDVGFLGHYHLRQQLSPNFWYVGAPMQHNWGDKNQNRGFIVYDTITKTQELIRLRSPQFIEMYEQELDEEKLEGNFVRIITDGNWTESKKSSFQKKHGVRSIEVVSPKMSTANGNNTRLNVNPLMAFNDMIKTYVNSDSMDVSGLDEDCLVQLGLEIMNEAQNYK